MDESRGKSGGQAVVVVVFLACLLTFLIFKFGKNTTSVVNQEAVKSSQESQYDNLTRQQILEKLKAENSSELYNKYLDKVFNEAKVGQVGQRSTDLSTAYQTELEQKTLLPEQIVFLSNSTIGNSYQERSLYLQRFENLFETAKKRGVFNESAILAAQASLASETSLNSGQVLALSDYDRETLLRIATEYELWAKQVLDLETPAVYENKSLAMANDILNTAFIIKKLVEEKDEVVYVMWIGKYLETTFDILANRYVK